MIHDEFISLLCKYGNDKYMIQEEITQLEHALQSAYISNLCGAPEDVIISLLYHDVGQLVQKENIGNTDYLHYNHDDIGRFWLEEREFPNFVCNVVGYHTLAKVLIIKKDKTYYDTLSEASKISYKIQKEKYKNIINNENNLVHIPSLSYRFRDLLLARLCDDMSKIQNLKDLPDLEYYRDMVNRVLEGEGKKEICKNWRDNIKKLSDYMREDREDFEKFMKLTLS